MISQEDIKLLIEGDKLAFRNVYDTFSTKVYQLAFRFLKDEVLSEEIVQEAFLKLWLNRQSLDKDGNMWLYLYVIGKRLCLNKLREIKKSQTMFGQLMGHIDILENETNSPLEFQEMESIIDNAIAHLPKKQQIVFHLSREEGLSHKEIAERLSISTNTVKNHMVQALKTLRNTIHDSGYSSVLLLIYVLTFSC